MYSSHALRYKSYLETSSGIELSLPPLPGRLLRVGDDSTSSGILASDALVGRPLVVLSVMIDASERGDCISVAVVENSVI